MKLDGKKFRLMCVSAANALDNNQDMINALNVFPVPDGDTGVTLERGGQPLGCPFTLTH